jgi:hypothetical protein
MSPATGKEELVTLSGGEHKSCSFVRDGKTRHLGPAMCEGLATALALKGQSLDVTIAIEIPDIPDAVLPEGQ